MRSFPIRQQMREHFESVSEFFRHVLATSKDSQAKNEAAVFFITHPEYKKRKS